MALQALFMDSRGNLPMTQEKPVTGFSGRFMAGLLCSAVRLLAVQQFLTSDFPV
jgi:hypothetical protein